MERISTMTLAGCYNASVNESETITEAQPFCPVRKACEAGQSQGQNFPKVMGFPVTPHIERS
jgi:hypothetical protein